MLGEGSGCRGDAVAYSFSLSTLLESQNLCPSVFPIKKELPLWDCFPQIPLHLSLFIFPTFCLKILLFPVSCYCFNFYSCSACNRRGFWVSSMQVLAYPWPSSSSHPTQWFSTHLCMHVISAWVNVCVGMCAWCVTKRGPGLESQSIDALRPNVLGFLGACNRLLNGMSVWCGLCLVSF